MKRILSIFIICVMMLSMITIVQAADFSGGGYNIVCVDGGRYLNVYAGKDADGTNVCVWERDGSPEQNYTISPCGGGKYKLYPASSSSRVIDVNRGKSYNEPLKAGLNIDLWRADDHPAQEFYITHVGNNLYKIELAALSGHVLQANSPNKNNGNVTLERYTGASNQHWKILKNGTQVTEPCTHKNISNKNEKITVAKKDDNTHTITTAYDEVCNDCGKTVKSNQKKTNSEKHVISNNKCSKCGYEVPIVEEKCNHSNTKENWQTSTISQKDDVYHTVEEICDVICVDCRETLKKSQKKTYEEKHSLKNDKCEKCSYVVPGSEASICKHKNTAKHSSDDIKTTISIKDDNQHTIASYYHVWCTDCFTYIKENELDLVHEDHKFVNNICSVCNLEKLTRIKTINDGLYNIKNASSGYMMNIYAGKDTNGTKVTVWENDNSNDQKIYISHQGDGKYLLKYNSSSNGRVIDVNRGNSMSASIDEGDKIDIWTSNDPEAQLFYIIDCGGDKYVFELASKPGYIISPASVSASKANGTQLELKSDINADYQQWYIVSSGFSEKQAWVNTDANTNLNFRTQPIMGDQYVDKSNKMPSGAQVTIIGEKTNGFYPIRYNGKEGYASAEWLTFTKPAVSSSSNIASQLGKRIANVYNYPKGTSYIGECVWYVRGRASEKLGVNTGITGNGCQWYAGAKARGISTGWTVRSNSIACFGATRNNSYGHVIFVEEVVGNNVYYTEANVEKPYSDGKISSLDGVLKVKSVSSFTSGAYQGCIYLK